MHISRPNSKSSSRSLHTKTTEISLERISIIIERIDRFHDAIPARGGLALPPNSSQVKVLSITAMYQFNRNKKLRKYSTWALEQVIIKSEKLGAASA